jgi:group I intron endonuclease
MSDPVSQSSFIEKAYIYKITNRINGKVYIGETKEKNPIKRWKGHLYTIRKGKGCPLLRAAIQKYGEENFSFEVIQECNIDERFIIEEQKIKEYNSLVPNGYNVTIGGMGGGFKGKKHSEGTKKKMAKATSEQYASLSAERKEELRQILKNRSPQKRGTITEEYRQKMRNYKLGKKLSEETRAKISNSLKHSALKEETRKKISESVKRTYENGRDASFSEERKANLSKVMTDVRGVKVEQYTKEGVFVKTYPSIKVAYSELNVKTGIDKVLSGKRKTAGGFIWKRAENC